MRGGGGERKVRVDERRREGGVRKRGELSRIGGWSEEEARK